MFLKRLELFGFKSFAKKTVFEFSSGITAIVGPNGSGKSNIADAILWVFGEKKAKSLRGEKMEDIIFTGTKEKSPLNMAEVSLTFDNSSNFFDSEYNEINITRRLYRTGDSSYMINKTPCRRKDILEKFMDTGIGKDAYSIISQGQIEQILSAKPVDRRYLFEETAGISKYKSRKEEALRKLENCKNDLVRVSDVLEELKSQIEPLKKQAKKAKKYKKISEMLKKLELRLFAVKIEEKRTKWYDLHEKTEGLDKELSEISAENKKMDANIENLKNKSLHIEKEIEAKNEDNNRVIEEIERNQAQKTIYEDKKNNLRSKIENLKSELANLDGEIDKKKEGINETDKELDQLEKNYEEQKNKYDIKVKELASHKEGEEDLNLKKLRENLDDVISQKSSLKANKTNQEKELENIREEIKKINDEKSVKDNEVLEQDRFVARLKDKKNDAEKELEDLTHNLDKKEQYLKDLSDKEKELTNKIQELKNHLQEKKSKIQMINEFKKDYRGFSKGVKEILVKKDKDPNFSGVLGTVSTLITVSDKYKKAIETSLGGALQNLVVDRDKDAINVINYLKKHKLGRATCLPLDNLAPRKLSIDLEKKATKSKGYLGVAANLLNTEKRFKVVADYLLARVIVMDDIKNALDLAKEINFATRIVTLDGEMVLPGGAMVGGSFSGSNKNSGFLDRDKEINDLKQSINSLNKELESNNKNLSKIVDEKNKLVSELDKIKDNKYNLMVTIKENNKELEGATKELKRLQKELDDISLKEKAKIEKRDEISNNLKKTNEGLRSVEEQENVLYRKQNEIETLSINRKDDKERIEGELSNIQVEMARLTEKIESFKDKSKKDKEDLNILKDKKERLKNDLKESGNTLDEYQTHLKELDKTINDLKEKQKDLTKSLQELKQERDNTKEKLLESEQIKNETAQKERKTEKKLNKLNVEKKEIETELKKLLDDLYEKYQLSFDSVLADNTIQKDELDINKTEKQLAKLKQGLDRLQPVNLGAIEEYNNLKSRLEFLQKQKDDLIEAENSLKNIIEDIDGVMKKKFKDTINQVNNTFKDTFKNLFGGGEASLRLTTPQDPLSSGVEIEARPPGKRLQSISLLSGGEKALTVISLLFSILKIKPTPFCILDEIDASLDEKNIYTYTKFLRDFSKKTQFIVITHRKETMQHCDALYGMSMAEAGISKLLSVSLNDDTLNESAVTK
ncbi:chromosome segregation protein SMC [Natranaerofaba carboxydovora]|uniref:chromosome segregation protein SMC n=1 Tax=Natranaerofaba carboxydovora TaxID=2742683 RepID=UPI001F1340AF|nr:chromosome segregation protein SMC [Natranaerofaba carboxydovora]UMZ73330.1 Chromosome partition protein Smc [Natranaerofaba carboxydovora]